MTRPRWSPLPDEVRRVLLDWHEGQWSPVYAAGSGGWADLDALLDAVAATVLDVEHRPDDYGVRGDEVERLREVSRYLAAWYRVETMPPRPVERDSVLRAGYSAAFTLAAVECHSWADCYSWVYDPETGSPDLDHVDTRGWVWVLDRYREVAADCRDFVHAEWLDLVEYARGDEHGDEVGDEVDAARLLLDASRAGHNFALSRGGHGAGFFDSAGAPEVVDRLQRAARVYGDVDLDADTDTRIVS